MSKPTLDEQRAHYDRWNVAYRSGRFEDVSLENRQRTGRVLELLDGLPVKPRRILEVGCGTGWLTEKLCEFGKVTAIDLSPKSIEVARTRGLPAEFIAADFTDYPVTPGSYDVAVCPDTLFYVHDQPRLVASMAAALGPDGHLFLTTLNKFVYERRRDIGPPEPGQVRQWLSRREIEQLLRPWFRVLRFETVGPQGDRGVLRIVNSVRLNSLLNRLFSEPLVRRTKERLGLGGGNIVMARKLAAGSP